MNVKKPRTLSQAYSLITEKTAFYSKDYPDDIEKSPDVEGMENLGFSEDPKNLKEIMTGMGLRKNVVKLFVEGGWNNNQDPKSFLKDFEFSFLQPICQFMAKTGFSNYDIESVTNDKNGLDSLEKAIQSEKTFQILEEIKKGIESSADLSALFNLCYNRSGKTVNDVAIGEGEILTTLFTNAKKAPGGGDLLFPNIGKVELKADEGRIGKPGRDINDNFKNEVKDYLLKNNKPIVSQNKQEIEEELTKRQEQLSEIFNRESYKRVFNDNFEIKIIEVLTELNSQTLMTLKKEIFAYKIPKASKAIEKSLDYTIEQYKKFNFLSDAFNPKEKLDQEEFRELYNEIRDLILSFDIGTSKAASDIFSKLNATFLKNFILQDFDLSLEQTAEILTLCVRDLSDPQRARQDIIDFLSKDNNFQKMKQGDQTILGAIVFALQLLVYSYNDFKYLLLINKTSKSCLAIDCSTKSVAHFIDKVMENKNNIIISVQMDNRGGSQITFF